MTVEPIIYIVDDSEELLEVISDLLTHYGFLTRTFTSGQEFLKLEKFNKIGCLLLDNQMPNMSGLEVQEQLQLNNVRLPVLFMSGASPYADVVDAIRNGAFGFLQKPFKNGELVEQVKEAVAASRLETNNEVSKSAYMMRLRTLTKREREVYTLVVEGQTNKGIALKLSISISTVEFHRRNMMEKLQVASLSQLMAIELRVNR